MEAEGCIPLRGPNGTKGLLGASAMPVSETLIVTEIWGSETVAANRVAAIVPLSTVGIRLPFQRRFAEDFSIFAF